MVRENHENILKDTVIFKMKKIFYDNIYKAVQNINRIAVYEDSSFFMINY